MNKNICPLISVVVPVYNVEDCICRCVDSILCQSYRNIEIILVDDGSTDLSGTICDKYEVSDNRIKVIHKQNGGLSDARNAGLYTAKGEYISFIDSDDFVHPHFLSILYNELSKNEADLAVCGYIKGRKNHFKSNNKPINYKTLLFKKEEMLFHWHSKLKHYETMAWNKLYKTCLFTENEIRYPKGFFNEDVLTTHLVVNRAEKIILSDFPLYYYFQRKNSITRCNTEKKIQDCIYAQKERISWFKEQGYVGAAERLDIRLQKYYMLMYVSMNSAVFKQLGNDIITMFTDNTRYVLGLNSISLGEKVIIIFFQKHHRFIRKILCKTYLWKK